MTLTDPAQVLAAYDQQVSHHPERDGATRVERGDGVVRVAAPDESWLGVVSSDLDAGTADAVIAAQVQRFSELGRPWGGDSTRSTNSRVSPNACGAWV